MTAIWRPAAAHPLTTIFVLALLVRLINVACLSGNDAFFAESDAYGYWALGAALAKPAASGRGLLSMTDRMPLYPLLLAGVQGTLGDVPRAVALIQAVIDAGTCVLIAALGALVSPWSGWSAGILAALSLTLVVFSTPTPDRHAVSLLVHAHAARRRALPAAPDQPLALARRPRRRAFAGSRGPLSRLLLVAAVPVVFVASMVQRRGFVPALAAALLFTVGGGDADRTGAGCAMSSTTAASL